MSETETREIPEELTYSDWADAVREGILLGQECGDCGHAFGTPKGACSHCGSRDLETVRLQNEGEVYTVTTINVPPEGLSPEYQVAVIQLGDARVMGKIEGETVEIGDDVEVAGATEYDDHPAPLFEKQ